MADMIKFYKGLLGSLPTQGANGALYITTDEGAIYLGTGTGMKRLGDFVQVDAVANLPTDGANTSSLYYCVAENILAKWTGSEWKQVNKQPTSEELKTLLGLGTMAYKSEVAEGDLNADLKAKVNAAAEGNHSHDNKALLDTYTQTEANLADAVAKKHEHANAAELAKIVDGDKAKWDAVAADHLTSADKTTLENAIKEAKQAGTDANTALETYKVANDARVKAVEEDVAEIVDGTNGILAQAKSYSDGKLATARTEISAEIDADVKVVADDLAGYKTANDAALAGVKATAEAAATKAYTDAELAKKVDKVEGKDLIATSEIERLATLHNYDDTQVKADIAKKADAATMTTELGKKVDKVEGFSLVADTEIARLKDVDNYDDAEVRGLIGDNADDIAEIAGDYLKAADKTALQGNIDLKADKTALEGEVTRAKAAEEANAAAAKAADDKAVAAQGAVDTLAGKVGSVPADKTVVQMIADAQAAATYDDEEVRGLIAGNAADIEELQGEIDTLNANAETEGSVDYKIAQAVAAIMENPDDTMNSIKELVDWVDEHAGDALELSNQVSTNKGDIAGLKGQVGEGTVDARIEAAVAAEAKRAGDAESALSGRIDTLAAINHEAYIAADTALKNELNAEIAKKANASTVSDMDAAYKAADEALSGRIKDLEDNKAGYATTAQVATAKSEAIAAAKTETETQVSALAETLYTKAEVEALIEAAHTWGSF